MNHIAAVKGRAKSRRFPIRHHVGTIFPSCRHLTLVRGLDHPIDHAGRMENRKRAGADDQWNEHEPYPVRITCGFSHVVGLARMDIRLILSVSRPSGGMTMGRLVDRAAFSQVNRSICDVGTTPPCVKAGVPVGLYMEWGVRWWGVSSRLQFRFLGHEFLGFIRCDLAFGNECDDVAADLHGKVSFHNDNDCRKSQRRSR